MGAPGCDNAPLIEVKTAPDRERRFTLIYPYYDNPEFLREQIVGWWGWPASLQRCVSLIIVDDASPEHPLAQVLLHDRTPFSTRAFRIEEDVRWNWLAARNIGAYHAQEGWLAITDMDHVVPVDTAYQLVCGDQQPKTIYRFSRREHDGKKIYPHPNSWFYTREMFWRIGGYDERMSGYYGSDGYYRRRCAATAPIRIMTAELERHEHIGDASTTRYKRKQPEDARLKQMVRMFPRGSPPRTLSFPYHEVLV